MTILLLLQATKSHLGARDVLLGVLNVVEQGLVIPGDALVLVGVGEAVAGGGARLAAEEAVQVGADLVATVLLDGVALSTTGLEEVGTLLSVTCREKNDLATGCSLRRTGTAKKKAADSNQRHGAESTSERTRYIWTWSESIEVAGRHHHQRGGK